MRGFRLHFLLAALSVGTFTAHADEWSGSIAAGIGARPDYLGSDDFELTPYIAGDLSYGPYFLEAQGQEVRLDFEPANGLALGPMMNIGNGRDKSVKSDRVGRLPKIGDAFEAGGFARYSWQGLFDRRDSLTLDTTFLADLSNDHDGAIGSLGLTYGRRLGDAGRSGPASA